MRLCLRNARAIVGAKIRKSAHRMRDLRRRVRRRECQWIAIRYSVFRIRRNSSEWIETFLWWNPICESISSTWTFFQTKSRYNGTRQTIWKNLSSQDSSRDGKGVRDTRRNVSDIVISSRSDDGIRLTATNSLAAAGFWKSEIHRTMEKSLDWSISNRSRARTRIRIFAEVRTKCIVSLTDKPEIRNRWLIERVSNNYQSRDCNSLGSDNDHSQRGHFNHIKHSG